MVLSLAPSFSWGNLRFPLSPLGHSTGSRRAQPGFA
jgi:hypothetical protein